MRGTKTFLIATLLMACAARAIAGADDTNSQYKATPAGAINSGVVILQSTDGGISTPINSSHPLVVTATGGVTSVTATDRGGTITSGGVAQTAIASNASRKSWCLQNDPSSSELLYVRESGTASATTGIVLSPGAQTCNRDGLIVTTAISVYAVTTGHRWFATEEQ